MMYRSAFSLLVTLLLASCGSSKKIVSTAIVKSISTIKFLGEYDIPYNLSFKNTTVGGLSGIDYDIKHDLYYMICDDRSERNPARFYTAKIFITSTGIDSMHFINAVQLLQVNNTVYPDNKQDPWHTPDPEAIRYNPVLQNLTWTSEGERKINEKDTILAAPAMNIIATNGKLKYSYKLPENLMMHVAEKSPRQNGVLEGMTFADNYKTIFVNVEEPLYEDGPRAELTDNNAYIRILKFDVASKTNMAQYAYKLDPVAYPANPEDAFKINGVPDILNIGNNKLLVIERSFSSGRLACTIKIFIADINNASNVKGIPSLNENKDFVPATKKLLFNMDDLGIYIDNIEGVTFGPLLPNGHKTLLFIADNNFNQAEKSQLLLFEVLE